MENKFTEEDKKKFVEFLNFIAQNARFPDKENGGVDTKFCIEYFKLLNYMQISILKKIDANIFEIKSVVNNPPELPKE